jgi:hypothetical protein
LTLLNTTVADNQNGIQSLGGTFNVQNTIIARNVAGPGPECGGAITSLGNNLVENPSDCSMTLLSSDLMGDPGLGVLSGGTIPLLSASPAIDAANAPACPPFDQLGLPRVDGDQDGFVACDIGAVEFIHHVVDIDVTPRGIFKPTTHKKITVDVFGPSDFAVEIIDPETMRAGVTGHEAAPTSSRLRDLDHDGETDLRLEFVGGALGVTCDSSILAFTAKTLTGESVAGAGPVITTKCK